MRFHAYLMAAVALAGVTSNASAADRNRKGTQARDIAPSDRGPVFGVGLGSADVDALADAAVRDIMSRPDIVGGTVPPRIVVDSEKLSNNSSQRIDRDMIADALRASLNRAAAGRIRFVSRESMDIIMRERELKRSGVADVGTRGMTRGVSGLDFTLIGRITSLDARDARSGLIQRRTQVVFELVDMETGDIPWTGQPFVIQRAAGDDVVYR